ncbi:MAG: Uma2 family endonuclease [Anaerolineales bacterium]
MATLRKSLSEFLEHPNRDTHRLELFDGEIYQKAPLLPDHLALASQLGATLDEFGFAGVEARILLDGGPGWQPSAPIPEVVFFRARPQLRGDWPKSAPELVVEIAPPKRNRLFTRGRVEAYLAGGTGAVWIVDVERHCVEVFERGSRRTLGGADRMTSQSVPGLAVPVSTLFVEIDRKALSRVA